MGVREPRGSSLLAGARSLLHRAPAAPVSTAPTEIALGDVPPRLREAVLGARTLRSSDPAALAALDQTLLGAEILTTRRLGDAGISGAPELLSMRAPDAAGGGLLRAVRKPATALPYHERFGTELSRAMGIDYAVGQTVVRDGQPVTAFVAGDQARRVGLTSTAAVDRTFERWYELNRPELGAAERIAAARTDRELLQVFDYVTALIDRHQRNVMGDPVHGLVTWIDQGHLLYGETDDVLRPHLDSTYLAGGRGTVEVSAATRELLRRRMGSGDAIEQLLAPLREVDTAGMHEADVRALRELTSSASAARMEARLAHVIGTGRIEYRFSPLGNWLGEHVGNVMNDSALVRRVLQNPEIERAVRTLLR